MTSLRCELIAENPDKWRLLDQLVYLSTDGQTLIVPANFETDFASVPRWPLVYWVMGGLAKSAAVLHDRLYSPPVKVARARADALFLEAARPAREGRASRPK